AGRRRRQLARGHPPGDTGGTIAQEVLPAGAHHRRRETLYAASNLTPWSDNTVVLDSARGRKGVVTHGRHKPCAETSRRGGRSARGVARAPGPRRRARPILPQGENGKAPSYRVATGDLVQAA